MVAIRSSPTGLGAPAGLTSTKGPTQDTSDGDVAEVAGFRTTGTPQETPPHDAVECLHAAGAHFVLCNEDKKPIWVRWQLRCPSVRQVLEHDGPVGIIYTSIDATCLDVDRQESPFAAQRLAKYCHTEMVWTSRQAGHFHVIVPDDLPRPNAEFSFVECSGEVRSATGYAIVWDAGAWQILHDYVHNLPVVAPRGLPDEVTVRNSPSLAPPEPSNAKKRNAGQATGMRLEDACDSLRDPALFDVVRLWAYHQDRGDDHNRWHTKVLDYALQQNRNLPHPLDDHVAIDMGRRVADYVWEHFKNPPPRYEHRTPEERVQHARENGIRSGESRRKRTPFEEDPAPWKKLGISESTYWRRYRWEDDPRRHRPLRQPRLQPWIRLCIGRSTWYERLGKVRAGKVLPRLLSGWDHLGIGELAPWEYLGLTQEEWERWYALSRSAGTQPSEAPEVPDSFDNELNRVGVSPAGSVDGAGNAQHFSAPSSDLCREAYLEHMADGAVELLEAVAGSSRPPNHSPVSKVDRRERRLLGKKYVIVQKAAAFEARKVATKNRNAFHREAKRKTVAWRREHERRLRESLISVLLDFLLDCEEERIAEQERTGAVTASLIARPVRIPHYDPSNPRHPQEYAMMMRDVEKKNLNTACRLFRRAQRRGEQPAVPLWLQQNLIQQLDAADAWRPHNWDVANIA